MVTGRRGRAVGRVELDLGDVVEELVEPRPAEDPDLGGCRCGVGHVSASGRRRRVLAPEPGLDPELLPAFSLDEPLLDGRRLGRARRLDVDDSDEPEESDEDDVGRRGVRGLRGRRRGGAALRATAVGLVEAVALERDADRGEDLLDRAGLAVARDGVPRSAWARRRTAGPRWSRRCRRTCTRRWASPAPSGGAAAGDGPEHRRWHSRPESAKASPSPACPPRPRAASPCVVSRPALVCSVPAPRGRCARNDPAPGAQRDLVRTVDPCVSARQ